jgi:hypothetical protein
MMALKLWNLRLAGLSKKKYKFIVLAPEMQHFSLSSLIVETRKTIQDIEYVICKLIKKNEEYLIKYRDEFQVLMYPSNHQKKIGYGNLMKFCNSDTIVIGHPGSAMIECINNGINFYPYFDYDKFIQNSTLNTKLLEGMHISRNKQELLDNLLSNKVFKDGFSKEDLFFKNGKYLFEIVSQILDKNIN